MPSLKITKLEQMMRTGNRLAQVLQILQPDIDVRIHVPTSKKPAFYVWQNNEPIRAMTIRRGEQIVENPAIELPGNFLNYERHHLEASPVVAAMRQHRLDWIDPNQVEQLIEKAHAHHLHVCEVNRRARSCNLVVVGGPVTMCQE
ncbi:MAG: hypothetical protein JW934_08075 [Anaerolineae bacterium]|nr:hypothetical protein [Anaerolineae bacterium]